MRFRLRTLIIVVTVFSGIALWCSIYRDYIDIRWPSYSSYRSTEIDDQIRDRVKSIEQDHPPRTKDYWERQLGKVKRDMTMTALFKYLPSIGYSYSLLLSNGNQIFYYAVDSKYGVACIMNSLDLRVLEPIGVFEHEMSLDEYGGIEIENIAGLEEFLTK